MAALAVVALDQPKVAVELRLTADAVLDVGRRALEDGREQALRIARAEDRLRRRTVEGRRAIEPVDLDEDGAALRRAAAPQDGVDPFEGAAAQVGRDEEVRAQPRHAATRCRSRIAPRGRGPSAPRARPSG